MRILNTDSRKRSAVGRISFDEGEAEVTPLQPSADDTHQSNRMCAARKVRSFPLGGTGREGGAEHSDLSWTTPSLTLPTTAGQSHMVFARCIGWLPSPLPLAGEADALEERGGWGLSPRRKSRCGGTPTPALPRKRERERSADTA